MADAASSTEVQLKLRFGEGLRDRLASAAAVNGASLNSEIVRRLEASLAQDLVAGGPATAALQAATAEWIAAIQQATGKSWAEDLPTYGAVRAAVEDLIVDAKPVPNEYKLEIADAARELDLATKQLDAANYANREGSERSPAIQRWLHDAIAAGDAAEAKIARLAAKLDELAEPGVQIFDDLLEQRANARRVAKRRGRGA